MQDASRRTMRHACTGFDSGKLLYKMTQSCAVRREPHPKAKLVTKKSAGARLHLDCSLMRPIWVAMLDETWCVLAVR